MNVSSWNKLPTKHRVTLFGMSTVVIIYLLYSFLLEPQWTHIATLKTQYNLERQQVKVVEAFVLTHPNPEEYVFELDNKIVAVDTMLPDNPDLSNFLLQIEHLTTECDLQLNYLKPGKIDSKQGYREIAVELSVKGNFSGIMKFLHKTESASRFMSIANISMQLTENGLESKMMVKIYSHGANAPLATNNNTTENKK